MESSGLGARLASVEGRLVPRQRLAPHRGGALRGSGRSGRFARAVPRRVRRLSAPAISALGASWRSAHGRAEGAHSHRVRERVDAGRGADWHRARRHRPRRRLGTLPCGDGRLLERLHLVPPRLGCRLLGLDQLGDRVSLLLCETSGLARSLLCHPCCLRPLPGHLRSLRGALLRSAAEAAAVEAAITAPRPARLVARAAISVRKPALLHRRRRMTQRPKCEHRSDKRRACDERSGHF
mmetsp:Transcript_32106/g.100859  ORF Transcript_32106/g.100859 Transcript_32106/m.100859 type:complete len:238 (+) Transcript_32106:1103-1816(+)